MILPLLLDSLELSYVGSGMATNGAPVAPIALHLEPSANPDPLELKKPLVGRIAALGRSFGVASEEIDGRPTRLAVDGTLHAWRAETKSGWTRYVADVDLPVAGRTARISFVRIVSAADLTVIPDYGYVGQARLDGKTYAASVAGDLSQKAQVWIDRNGDGRRQSVPEVVSFGNPFNFTGTTHNLRLVGERIKVEKATAVPILPEAPDLRVGKLLPNLSLRTTTGETLRVPQSFRGKLVLLDFWATWCPPCVEALPTVADVYSRFRSQGLEVLGIDLDDESSRTKAAELARNRGVTWPQIFDGKGMQGPIPRTLGVEAIPLVLLVDGDSGRILATDLEIEKKGLAATVEAALDRKRRPNS